MKKKGIDKRRNLRTSFALILCFILIVVFSTAASAKNLKLAVGLALPPYFIAESKTGMEYEIISATLKRSGHRVSMTFVPFSRVKGVMMEKRVDCASPINPNSGVKAFYTDSHISYQNAAISLSESKLKIKTINDLSNKSIVGFQDAKKYLGPEFKSMADKNRRYIEKYNQKMQTKYLYNRRAQVLVMDVKIFKYFKKRVIGISNTTLPVVFHELFPKTPYSVAFRDESMKDIFNKGLREIKANGTYDKIISSYID